MAERLVVIDKARVDFDGLFEVKGVLDVLKEWASDKGYWIIEKVHSETSRPEGRMIDFVLEPFKKMSDYVKYVLKVRLQFSNVKDVVIDRDGHKVKVQEGKVSVLITGIVETDYEHKWEKKPLWYTLRVVLDKYLLTPFMSSHERDVKSDCESLKDNLKSFLNFSKFW